MGFAHLTDRLGSALVGALVSAKVNDDGSYNELGGIDAAWQSGTDRLVGQVLVSRTRNPDRPDLLSAWRGQAMSGLGGLAEWDHTGSVVSTLRYLRYDPGFRSWLGYVPRVGYSDYYGRLTKPFYRSSALLKRIAPYVSLDRLEGIGTTGHEQDLGVGVSLSGYKASALDASWHPGTRVLTTAGEERTTSQVRWTASIQPGPRVPLVALNGTLGTDVDFATGIVAPVTSLAATLRTRPLDSFELEGRFTYYRLGDERRGYRLVETIPEVLATWYFASGFYVLGDLQMHRSRRRLPGAGDSRSSLSSVQFVWEPALNWRGYFGVRSGEIRPSDPTGRGRSTEVYAKITRRLGLGG